MVSGLVLCQMRLSDEPVKPSCVLHLRGLPPDTTEAEITSLTTIFGVATNIILTRQKDQVWSFRTICRFSCSPVFSADILCRLDLRSRRFSHTFYICSMNFCWSILWIFYVIFVGLISIQSFFVVFIDSVPHAVCTVAATYILNRSVITAQYFHVHSSVHDTKIGVCECVSTKWAVVENDVHSRS